MLGCGPNTTSRTVLCIQLMMSTLSFRFALPGKWPVCCIGSNLISLCGVVHFATCLTAWINSFPLSFCSITVLIVFVVIIVVVENRVLGATVFVARISLCAFNLLFLFQQATLISIMSWFFAVVARWFVFQRSRLWHNSSQHLFAARQQIPNLLSRIPFLGMWQSVLTCHFPNGPDLLIFSGVVALWHI